MVQMAVSNSSLAMHRHGPTAQTIMGFIFLWQLVAQMLCIGFHLPQWCSINTTLSVGSSWLLDGEYCLASVTCCGRLISIGFVGMWEATVVWWLVLTPDFVKAVRRVYRNCVYAFDVS